MNLSLTNCYWNLNSCLNWTNCWMNYRNSPKMSLNLNCLSQRPAAPQRNNPMVWQTSRAWFLNSYLSQLPTQSLPVLTSLLHHICLQGFTVSTFLLSVKPFLSFLFRRAALNAAGRNFRSKCPSCDRQHNAGNMHNEEDNTPPICYWLMRNASTLVKSSEKELVGVAVKSAVGSRSSLNIGSISSYAKTSNSEWKANRAEKRPKRLSLIH